MTDSELIEWWEELDLTWKRIFKSLIDINHKPSKIELNQILDLETIDCSDSYVLSLDPLKCFNKIKKIDCSKSKIRSLEKIKHLSNLEELNISNTKISNLKPLTNLKKLHSLICNNCSELLWDEGIEGCDSLIFVEGECFSLESLKQRTGRDWTKKHNFFITSEWKKINFERFKKYTKNATDEQLVSFLSNEYTLIYHEDDCLEFAFDQSKRRGLNLKSPITKKYTQKFRLLSNKDLTDYINQEVLDLNRKFIIELALDEVKRRGGKYTLIDENNNVLKSNILKEVDVKKVNYFIPIIVGSLIIALFFLLLKNLI